jgi:hypothetical protein
MPNQQTAPVTPYLTGPATGVAILFIALPIVDTLSQVLPLVPGNAGWRYGVVGLGSNYLVSVLFGMLLWSYLEGLQLHRRTLRALAVVNGVVAVLMVLVALGFLLDAAQVRATLPRDNFRSLKLFDVGAAKAVFKYLVSAPVLGWIALASWRATRVIPQLGVAADPPKLIHEQSALDQRVAPGAG